MIERWRCFVAVPLPEDLRLDLTNDVTAWRAEPDAPDLRWTDPAGWHLTLAFLGWIDAELSEDVLARLVAPAKNARQADLTAGGLGAFPSPRRARVLWYGIADERSTAGILAAGVRRALAPIAPRV